MKNHKTENFLNKIKKKMSQFTIKTFQFFKFFSLFSDWQIQKTNA